MTRAGPFMLFIFILNLTLSLIAGIGISVGTITPYISNSTATNMTSTDVWRTSDVLSITTILGYFYAVGALIVTAILFMITLVLQVTVGAPAFYEQLFAIVVGAGVSTSIFGWFFGLIQNFVILFFIYEQYKGGDTNV